MNKIIFFLVLLFSPSLVMATGVNGNDPASILAKSKEIYSSLKTYKTQGIIVSPIPGGKQTTHFSILLKKPNLYLIVWENDVSKQFPNGFQGAIWDDGSGPYAYTDYVRGVRTNMYWKEKNDDFALHGAAMLSYRATYSIPAMFLPVFAQEEQIVDLINPVFRGIENVDHEDCYVVTGSSKMSQKVILWISKSTFLIRKHEYSILPPGFKGFFTLTDEQLGSLIKSQRKEDTPQARRALKESFNAFVTMIQNGQGETVETYTDISSPELTKDVFTFKLPQGTVLKDLR